MLLHDTPDTQFQVTINGSPRSPLLPTKQLAESFLLQLVTSDPGIQSIAEIRAVTNNGSQILFG